MGLFYTEKWILRQCWELNEMLFTDISDLCSHKRLWSNLLRINNNYPQTLIKINRCMRFVKGAFWMALAIIIYDFFLLCILLNSSSDLVLSKAHWAHLHTYIISYRKSSSNAVDDWFEILIHLTTNRSTGWARAESVTTLEIADRFCEFCRFCNRFKR